MKSKFRRAKQQKESENSFSFFGAAWIHERKNGEEFLSLEPAQNCRIVLINDETGEEYEFDGNEKSDRGLFMFASKLKTKNAPDFNLTVPTNESEDDEDEDEKPKFRKLSKKTRRNRK